MFLMLTVIFSAIAHVSVVAQQALPQTDGVSTCNATSAARGETATVTCLFPLDVISARPVAVSVEVYRNKEIETVLECRWLENDDDIICDQKEGYSLQRVAGSQLNLVITALSEHHAGLYACKMMTPRFYVSGFRPCRLEELQVAEGNTGKSSGTVEKPKKAEMDSAGPKVDDDWLIDTDGEDNKDKAPVTSTQKAETNMIGIILGVVLTVLFLVAVGLFLFFCHVKKRRGRRGSVAQGSCTSCFSQHGRNEEGMYSGQPPEYQRGKERLEAQYIAASVLALDEKPAEKQRLINSTNEELSKRNADYQEKLLQPTKADAEETDLEPPSPLPPTTTTPTTSSTPPPPPPTSSPPPPPLTTTSSSPPPPTTTTTPSQKATVTKETPKTNKKAQKGDDDTTKVETKKTKKVETKKTKKAETKKAKKAESKKAKKAESHKNTPEPAKPNPTGYEDDKVETEDNNPEASSVENPNDLSAERDRRESFRDEVAIRSAAVGLHNKKTLEKYKTLNPKATRNL